jgi:hypothetical protein
MTTQTNLKQTTNAMAIPWHVENELQESCSDSIVKENAKLMMSLLETEKISGICTTYGMCFKLLLSSGLGCMLSIQSAAGKC